MMGRIQEFCVNAPNSKTLFFLLKIYLSLQKGTNTYVQRYQPKKVTSRGRGAGIKNKIQGTGPFFGRILVDDRQSLAPQEKNSITRSTIHR